MVKEIVENLLSSLGFLAKLEVQPREGDSLLVTIDAGPDNPLLIGFHGETLSSLQTVVNLILFRKMQSPTPRVTLDIGSYRLEREEKIKQLAVGAADRARFLARSVELSPMRADERRLVHLFVSQLPGVSSESVGEGRERRVIVKPASPGEKTTD